MQQLLLYEVISYFAIHEITESTLGIYTMHPGKELDEISCVLG